MLHFAQISDIHINRFGQHHDVLGGQAADFLSEAVMSLNQQDDLDFVLISGDVVDNADPRELMQFDLAMSSLRVPFFIIPGNHDRRLPDAEEGLTRYEFAQRYNPQIEQRPSDGESQAGYWSITVKPTFQLIGLDSVRDADWGGEIDTPQMEWLKQELVTHADKVIIVTIHHPLHPMTPLEQQSEWQNFVCHTAPDLLTLLDQHPQVKLVLTGHRHITKADWLGARLHLACPALSIYPCGYRTIRLREQPNGMWHITWQTHSAVNQTTLAQARQMLLDNWGQVFDEAFVEDLARVALGRPSDQAGEGLLR